MELVSSTLMWYGYEHGQRWLQVHDGQPLRWDVVVAFKLDRCRSSTNAQQWASEHKLCWKELVALDVDVMPPPLWDGSV